MRSGIGPVVFGLVCALACAFRAAAGEPFAPRWVAGDLHVHTTYSHDSWGGPGDDNTGLDEAYTFGWSVAEQIFLAELRGLDYLAFTDHDDTRSSVDPGYHSERLVLIPAYESSLAGHVQMLGATSCYARRADDTIGVVPERSDCNAGIDPHSATDMFAIRDTLRAAGGAFQINHPYDGHWRAVFGDGGAAEAIVPDSVEIWNIGPWFYQSPLPAASDNETAIAYWQTFLDAGDHVTATGGSDNHWRSTTAVQGVGQPTTWVYVTEPGMSGVIGGIRAGRTTISSQPPAQLGPRLFLEADADGDGVYESMVGDVVAAEEEIAVRVKSVNVLPGAIFRIVSDMETKEQPALTSEWRTTIGARKWFRAELRRPDLRAERSMVCDPLVGTQTTLCRNGLLVEALTSAIYVAAPDQVPGVGVAVTETEAVPGN